MCVCINIYICISPWLVADEARVSHVLSHVVWWKKKYIYIYIYILFHCLYFIPDLFSFLLINLLAFGHKSFKNFCHQVKFIEDIKKLLRVMWPLDKWWNYWNVNTTDNNSWRPYKRQELKKFITRSRNYKNLCSLKTS